MAWAAANMADALQTLGYTATNATAEANAWMLGYAADSTTIHVITAPSYDIALSERPDVDQSITDLAKSITDPSQLSSIITSMAQANSVTAMEATLTQLDSKYGSSSQSVTSDNADKSNILPPE